MDEPARRVVPTDAWLRWFWLWDLYFAVGYLSVTALVLTDEAPTNRKVVAVAVLTVLAIWYLAYGRRVILADDAGKPRRARIFVLGVVLLMIVAVGFDGTASFALFAACPLVFMSLDDLREAVPTVVIVVLLPPVSMLVRDGAGPAFQTLGLTTVFTLLFAVLIGTWIHRIVTQSQERAELIRELEESREEIARLSREAGVAGERARLAAEIHDTLAQGFTSLVTLVQAAESELDRDPERARGHLALAARTARENLTEARALVAGLMPSELGGTGSLDQAIRRQLARLAEETPVQGTYEVDGESTQLPTVLEVVLLRAVQEALTNVRRHAGAAQVRVTLRVDEGRATLRVADDGVGFAPGATEGFGLRGMRARARQVGGTLTVGRGEEGGTVVELEVPR